MNLNGCRVVASAHAREFRPKISLTPGICSPKVEAEMNAWLLETFGATREVLMAGGVIFAHPNTVRLIEQQLRHQNATSKRSAFDNVLNLQGN